MAYSVWHSPIMVMTSDGASLSNSTTQTSILQPQFRAPIGANSLLVGQRLYVRGAGRLSNIVTTPGTLTLQLLYGATSIFTSGAMQLSTTAHTTLPFDFDIQLTVRAVGATANMFGQGKISGQGFSLTAVADSTTTVATLMMPNTTPAVGSNFDHGTAGLLDLQATFSIANAANLIQLHQYEVYLSN